MAIRIAHPHMRRPDKYEILDEDFDDADDGLLRDSGLVLLPRRIIQPSSPFDSSELTREALADRSYVPARNRSERASQHEYRITIVEHVGRSTEEWRAYLEHRYHFVRSLAVAKAAEKAEIAALKQERMLLDAEQRMRRQAFERLSVELESEEVAAQRAVRLGGEAEKRAAQVATEKRISLSMKASDEAIAWCDYFWQRVCETRSTTWGEIEAENLTKQWRRDWEAQRQEALILDAQLWRL